MMGEEELSTSALPQTRVDIYVRPQDSMALVDPLVEFFEPVASVEVRGPEEHVAVKAIRPIEIIVTTALIAAPLEWAIGRYLLNPLADRIEEWVKSVASIQKHSRFRRSFRVTIEFQYPTDSFKISFSATSDPNSLKSCWRDLKSAYQVYESARSKGTRLDRIRFLPDGSDSMLVVGYVGNRPVYTIDLDKKTLKTIKSGETDTEDEAVSAKLFVLSTVIRRLEYLKALAEAGYQVSEDQIAKSEELIESTKKKLREY